MSQVRDFQNNFFATLSQTAISMYDKYNQENSDIDSLPEPARLLLSEKEQLVNALQVQAGREGIGGIVLRAL